MQTYKNDEETNQNSKVKRFDQRVWRQDIFRNEINTRENIFICEENLCTYAHTKRNTENKAFLRKIPISKRMAWRKLRIGLLLRVAGCVRQARKEIRKNARNYVVATHFLCAFDLRLIATSQTKLKNGSENADQIVEWCVRKTVNYLSSEFGWYIAEYSQKMCASKKFLGSTSHETEMKN